MKKINALNKTLLAVALTTGLGLASTSAMAALLNPFSINESSVPGAGANPALTNLQAGKFIGNYVEDVTFSGGASGTFSTVIRWNAGDIINTGGIGSITNQLGSFSANQYGLYIEATGSGTYAPGAGTTTVFTFVPSGAFAMYIDPLSDTTFSGGLSNLTHNPSPDDYLIATGGILSGLGTLDPSLSTCTAGGGNGINCGSFGSTASFALTTLGKTYFTGPNPFYNVSFQSGQFDVLTPSAGGTQATHGSMDVVFANTVPEPTTIALLGMGLMGFAFRRRNQA